MTGLLEPLDLATLYRVQRLADYVLGRIGAALSEADEAPVEIVLRDLCRTIGELNGLLEQAGELIDTDDLVLQIHTKRDEYENLGFDTMTVNVLDIEPPVADAGADQTLEMGNAFVFDGSDSTDNIGIDKYIWTFVYSDLQTQLWGTSSLYHSLCNPWSIGSMIGFPSSTSKPLVASGPTQTRNSKNRPSSS